MVPECLWRKVLLPTQGWGQVFFDEAINPNPKGWVVHHLIAADQNFHGT